MPSTISQSYAGIARQHNLGTSGSTEAMKNLAMRWMEEQTEEWLMIFDDCKLSERQGYLPGRGKGNVIYTSRSTKLGLDLPPNCVLEVAPFSEEDAVELLLKASGGQQTPANPQDMDWARAIVHELGSLPLAIDKAAASIRDLRLTLRDYFGRLRDGKVRILSDPRFKDKNVENTAVYATLELSHDAIMARRKREGRNGSGLAASLAVKLLGLLSFYHHQGIPLEAMRRAATERAERKAHVVAPLSKIMDPPDRDFDRIFHVGADGKWDVHYFGVGMRVLESFSLIKLDHGQDTVSMHVLVHRWARHRMEEKEYRQYDHLTRVVLTEAIVMSWKWQDAAFTRQLRPHLHLCHGSGQLASASEDHLAWLHLKLGWHYHLDKDFYAAEASFLRCLRTWRIEHGSYSWDVINVLELLGLLYHEIGRLADAELTFLELVERMKGRISDCEEAMAEGQSEQEQGPSRGSVSNVPSKRTGPAHAGKLSGALSLQPLSRLLESRRNGASKGGSVVESEEPSTSSKWMAAKVKRDEPRDDIGELWILHRLYHANLARTYIDQGRIGMGKRLLTDTLRLLDEEGDIPKEHFEFLRLEHEVRALTDPGNLEYWNKRANDMVDLIEAGETMLLESDAYFQLIVAHANCLLKNGMWDLAHRHFQSGYGAFEKVWGPCDRRILEILRRMVDCNVEGDRCDLAVETARDCLDRARTVYGENHQETVLALEKLYEALLYQKLEDDEDGEGILRGALVRSELALGSTHPTTKRIRYRLRLLTHRLKQPETAFRPGALGNLGTSSGWRRAKRHLEKMKAQLGTRHLLVRRFARVVGDCPPSTVEEHAERVLACFGPHSSITRNIQRGLELRRAASAERRGSEGGVNSSGARGAGVLVDLCTCGEPAHAEGSRGRDALYSDISRGDGPGGQDQEMGALLDTNSDGESDAGDEELLAGSWNDTKNKPVYFCGMY
jgi:hypothetical protein